MKKDRDIVLAAVQQSGMALQYAYHTFSHDKEIALAAVKQSKFALDYVSEALKNDQEIISIVSRAI